MEVEYMKKHIHLERVRRCEKNHTECERKNPRKPSPPKKEVISFMIDAELYELFHECLSYDETTKTEVMLDWIHAYIEDHPALEEDEEFDDDDYEEFDDYEDEDDDECFRIDLPDPKDFISDWIGEVNLFLNNEVTRVYYDAHIKVPNKIRRDIEDAIDSLYGVVHKIYIQDQYNSRANCYEDEYDDRTDTRKMRQRERDE